MSFSILQENHRQVCEGYSKRNKSNNESCSPTDVNIVNIKKALDDCERIFELCKDLDNTIDETIEENDYPVLVKRERDQITNETQVQNHKAKNIKLKEHNQFLPTPTDSDHKNKMNENNIDQPTTKNSILSLKNSIGNNQPNKNILYHNNQISQVHTNSKQSDLYPIIPNDIQNNFSTKNSAHDKIYQEQFVHKAQHENHNYKSSKVNTTQSTSIIQRALVSKNVNKNQTKASIHQSDKKNYNEYNNKNHLDSIEQPRNLKINYGHTVNNNEYYKVPIRRLSADSMYEEKIENSIDGGLEATNVIEPVRDFEPNYITINNKNYMVLDNIGEGGYGAVYKVYDANTKEVLAIKDIKGKGEGEELKNSILNEVYYLKQAKHRKFKHTVKMYDYEVFRYGSKIVMELGDTDFQKALRKQIEDYPINMNYVRYFWGQILYAVKEWHDTFTLHKDLKPQNFILKRGRIKLIDFGTTVALGSSNVERSKRAVGTLNYMAPETLVASDGLSKAGLPADIWSLGCILYEMIYKKPPLHRFDESNKRTILHTRDRDAIKYPNHVDWMPVEGNYKYKRVSTTYVDDSAIDCMKSCLNYDAKKRPTIDQLIDHPFIKYYEIKN